MSVLWSNLNRLSKFCLTNYQPVSDFKVIGTRWVIWYVSYLISHTNILEKPHLKCIAKVHFPCKCRVINHMYTTLFSRVYSFQIVSLMLFQNIQINQAEQSMNL